MNELKTCIHCHKILPIYEFHRDKNRADGHVPYCKDCVSKAHGHKTQHKRLKPAPTGMKRCSECLEVLPATRGYFYKNGAGRNGLLTTCIPCTSKLHRIFREEHKDEIREQRKRLYPAGTGYRREYHLQWSAENQEHLDDYRRQYRIDHREKISKKNREIRLRNPEQQRAQRKEHAVQRRIYQHNRRAKTLSHEGLTVEQWQSALEHFDFKCAVCGKLPDFWTIICQDHWIPIAKGGTNSVTNVVPLCHSVKDGEGGCNNRKSDKSPMRWLIDQFGKRKAKLVSDCIETYFASVNPRKAS